MSAPFVILTTQRSGSTWVVDMLDAHARVAAYSELFLEGGKGRRFAGAQDLEFYAEFTRRGPSRQPAGVAAYLDRVFAPRPDVDAIGFKLMYGQLGAHPQLASEFVRRAVRVVHLVRSNLLDVLISRETAVARDLFHLRPEETAGEARVTLVVADLPRKLDELQAEVLRAEARIAEWGVAALQVQYEDLADDWQQFARLLDFLGVADTGTPLASALRRINSPDQARYVVNLDEVRDLLQGSAHARFLR